MVQLGCAQESRGLTVCQGVVTHVVARRVGIDEEQHSNVGRVVRGSSGDGRLGLLHRDGPGDVAAQETACAGQVHDTSADASDEERDGDTAEQTPAGNRDVDLLDVGRILEADEGQEITEVVRDERVAGPLGEETEHGGDEETATHTGRLEQVTPRPLGCVELELDRRLHLHEFGLDELDTAVSLAVVLDQDVLGLLAAVFGDEPAGGLGEEARRRLVST